MRREAERGHRHRGDQRAGRQRGLHLRGVAGQRVELGQRDRRPLVPVHPGVQRGQGDGHVGRVRRDAVLGRAEDAELAVHALDRRAAGAGRALVAGLGDVLEVAATGALQQVAADGRGIAQLPGGAGQQRLGQHRIALPDPRVGGEVAVAGAGADAQAAVGLLDPGRQQPGHVHQQVRRLHPEFHQVDQVGAAGEELRVRAAGQRDGAGRVGGPDVVERLHRAAPASCTAATMFGYAPHRHRLPLIRSATSASLSDGSPSVTRLGQPAPYSASAPTAEHTWPGVQ